MRIVLIDKETSFKIDGIKIYNDRLRLYLTGKNHEVTTLRFAKKKIKEKDVYPIPYYLAEPRTYIFLPSEKTLPLIKKYLQKTKPDIVYTCMGLTPFDIFLPSLCHELKIPIAGVFHGDFSNSSGAYQLLAKSAFLAHLTIVKQLDLLHFFTKKLAQFFITRGVKESRVFTLPNGVDTRLYSPGKSLFIKKNKFKTGILFLGRLTLQKNPEVLIKTFLRLNPPGDCKLILVGTGELEKNLRRDYVDKRIIFTGVVNNEKEKIDIMRSCSIFVLPSRYEGMSLALLEAMSVGLACIATDAGSGKELLDKNGVVIPAPKVNRELPISLRLLMEQPNFVSYFARKARKRVLRYYSQEKIYEKLVNRLQNTIIDCKKRGFPKSMPLSKNLIKKLTLLWQKTKKVRRNLLDTSF